MAPTCPGFCTAMTARRGFVACLALLLVLVVFGTVMAPPAFSGAGLSLAFVDHAGPEFDTLPAGDSGGPLFLDDRDPLKKRKLRAAEQPSISPALDFLGCLGLAALVLLRLPVVRHPPPDRLRDPGLRTPRAQAPPR